MPRTPGRRPTGTPLQLTRTRSLDGEPAWQPSADHDPGDVAAAYAQAELVAAIGRKFGRLNAADIARRLGRPTDDRTIPDVIAGRSWVNLQTLMSFALALDIWPFDHANPTDVSSLLPPEYRARIGPWRPGQGRPHFADPSGEPQWERATAALAEWIRTESERGSLRLADQRIFVHQCVSSLADAGLSIALISDTASNGTDIEYETTPSTRICVTHLPDSVDRDVMTSELRRWYASGADTDVRSVVVLVATPRSWERLDHQVRGMAHLAVGGATNLPDSIGAATVSAGELPVEVTLAVLARTESDGDRPSVAALELHKDGIGPDT